MASATIVAAYKDATYAYASAAVVEASGDRVEYVAKTPLVDANGIAYTVAQLKANLTAALSAVRNASLAGSTSAVAISGTITV